ncbi:MAG: dihydroorotate dehydrogenase [archaeon]
MSVDISTEICGLRMRNPLILAAGILGISGETLRRVGEAGAGAVVTKSYGVDPRAGYPNPTVVEVVGGLMNAMGLPNPGVAEMGEEVVEARKAGVPVIASIYGCGETDYVMAAEIAESSAPDAIELNVSCPHVKEVGAQIGQDPEMVGSITEAVKQKVKVPVFVKLTPNVTDITEIAKSAERGGADAITAINTVKALAIDIDTRRPVLAAGSGGLSGPSIKPIAIRCVHDISKSVGIPVIGCGGVMSWRDVIEYTLAGASAVQIGTALMYKDLTVFKEIDDGLRNYLSTRRIDRLSDLRGQVITT